MPSAPKPKTFRAVTQFSTSGAHFKPGDVVTGQPLETALRFGERFVISDQAARRAASAETPPTEPAETAEKE